MSSRGLTLATLAVLAWVVLQAVADLRRSPGGHDFRAMCRALDDIGEGRARLAYAFDPPDRILPLAYPFLAVAPLRPLCANPAAQPFAWLGLIAAATVLLLLAFPDVPPLIAVGFAVSAFRAPTWIMWTGNIAAVDFALLALAVYAFGRGRDVSAGVCLGLAGFIRILPLGFVAAIVLTQNARRAASVAVASIATFVALHIASALLWPEASGEYWRGLFSGFGGSVAETTWFGSTTHPSMLSAALAVGRRLPNTFVSAMWIYAMVSAVLAGAFALAWRAAGRQNLLWAGMVLVLLLSPRLMPYNFALAIPAALAAAAPAGASARAGLLIVVTVLPVAAFAVTGAARRAHLFGYMPLISLAALYSVLLVQRVRGGGLHRR